MNKNLDSIWENSGYISSVDKLLKLARKHIPDITRNEIQKFITKQTLLQIFTKKTKKISGHITAFYTGELMQADLLDYQKFKYKNRYFSWILITIDVFTRQAYAVPLKSKSSADMYNGLKNVFDNFITPSRLTTDNGKEFLNMKVQDLFKKYNIRHFPNEIGDHKALGIIDRFSRTLRERIEKEFIISKSTNWIDVLDRIITQYNHTPHRSLGELAPIEIEPHDENIIDLNEEKDNIKIHHKLKSGDLVRKRLQKGIFEKGATRIWSLNTFKIDSLNRVTAILTNGEKVRIENLLKVTDMADINYKIRKIEKAKRKRISNESLTQNPKKTRSGLEYY